MKIGITCYPTYGGSGVVATELGVELAERGHEIHFISYAQPIRLTELHPNIHYHSSFAEIFLRGIRYSNILRTTWLWPRAWRKFPNFTLWIFCTCITRFPIP